MEHARGFANADDPVRLQRGQSDSFRFEVEALAMRGHTKFAIVLIILGTILIFVLRSLTANNVAPERSDVSRVAVPLAAPVTTMAQRARPDVVALSQGGSVALVDSPPHQEVG